MDVKKVQNVLHEGLILYYLSRQILESVLFI